MKVTNKAIAVHSSNHALRLDSEFANDLMYQILNDRLKGGLYKIYTDIDTIDGIISTSFIKADETTIFRFMRFEDETTKIFFVDAVSNPHYFNDCLSKII